MINSKEVHENASDNGFWDINPDYLEIYRIGCALLLILDEMQEAHEAKIHYSALADKSSFSNKASIEIENAREGVVEEWADVALRCLDLLGFLGKDTTFVKPKGSPSKNVKLFLDTPDLEKRTRETIFNLARRLRKYGNIEFGEDIFSLQNLIVYILGFQDIYEAAVQKNEKNKEREFMHGKFF